MIEIQGSRVTWDGQELSLDGPIAEAVADQDMLVVRFAKEANPRPWAREFRNLAGYSRDGKELWRARLPDDMGSYYGIDSTDPLRAWAPSWEVVIDIETGELLETVFTK